MSATTPFFVGQFTQSEATAAQRTFSFVAVDVTDGLTVESGLTYAGADCTISKNGGAFGNLAGTVAEIGSTGVYQVVLAAGDLDTLGTAIIKFVDAAARDVYVTLQVIADDLNDENTAAEIATEVFKRMNNVVIDGGDGVAGGPTYDSAGMLTAGRIRVFATGAEALAATGGAAADADGEIAAFTIGASGSNGRMTLYRVSED